MMYEGDEINTIDLLYESATSERNGVKVIIPVKSYDRSEFLIKIKEQLAYFESVYFNVPGIDNSHLIVRSEHFQFSEISFDKHMHICLDNVYYPIDFKKLGISQIEMPIGLRFSLTDGIFPTPNRESIRYTAEAIQRIKNKMTQVADYFIQKYNDDIKEVDNFIDVYKYYRDSNRYVTLDNKGKIPINSLFGCSSIKIAPIKMKGISHLDLQRMVNSIDYVFGEYRQMYEVNRRDVFAECKHGYNRGVRQTWYSNNKPFIYTNRIPGIKKEYLKHLKLNRTYDAREFHIYKKDKSYKLFGDGNNNYDNYYTILILEDYDKSLWRTIIQEFQLIVKSVVDTFVNIDEMIVPQSFIDSRKKVRVSTSGVVGRRVKLEGEFSCKIATELERDVHGKNCKWVPTVYQMKNFHTNKFLMVYGSQDDAVKMDKWYPATKKHKIKFCTLSDRELKNIEKLELHNLISFSKFMEGKSAPFKRIASACYIKILKDNHKNAFAYRGGLKGVSTQLHDKIEELETYLNKNNSYMDSETAKSIIDHANEVNAFDLSIHHVCLEVEDVLNKFPFIGKILSHSLLHTWSKESDKIMQQALIDLLKYHRYRVNLNNYKLKLDEEVALEQTLTTEDVQELID